MSVENILQDLAINLKSSKKKDRVSALGHVCSLIEQERIVAHLSECSRGTRLGICWDTLFSLVHNAVLAVVDNSAVTPKLMAEMGMALRTVLNKSHKRVKAFTLTSAILAVMGSREFRISAGKIYLDMACLHLLQHSEYHPEISPEHWTDMVDLCKQQYSQPDIAKTSLKYFELLAKVVTAGVRYSLPATTVANLLPFLQHVLSCELPPSRSFELDLLQLVNTSLLTLAANARHEVAAFTETVHDVLFRMYKTGKDTTSLLFQFFAIAVNVHHPQGAGPEDPLVYASDWTQWKVQLAQIYQLCETEVSEIIRSGESCIRCEDILKLAVDVSFVMSLIQQSCGECSPEIDIADSPMLCTGRKRKSTDLMTTQTQKRAKLVSASATIGTILSDMTPRDHWFWLTYLEVLIERHPSAVLKDYVRVVQLVCNMLCHVRGPPTLGPLSRCALLLLNLCPVDLPPDARNALKTSWDKTSESLLRSVGKDNPPELHTVLQALISRSLMKDLIPLLDLYLNRNIPESVESISTLVYLVENGLVKDDKCRRQLLQWGLRDILNPALAASLVLSLLINQAHLTEKPKKKTSSKLEFFDVYGLLTLEKEAVSDRQPVSATENKDDLQMGASVAQVLGDILIYQSDKSIERLLHTSVTEEHLTEAANLIEVILRILSAIWKNTSDLKLTLMTQLKLLLSNFTSSLVTLIDSKKAIGMQLLAHLYALDLQSDLQRLIRNQAFTDVQLLQRLLNFIRNDRTAGCALKLGSCEQSLEVWHQSASKFSQHVTSLAMDYPDISKLFGRELFVEKEQIFLFEAMELLSLFLAGHGHYTDTQISVIAELLTALSDHSMVVNSPLQLQLMLRVVHMVASRVELDVDHLNACLETLICICQEKFVNTSVLIMSLVVLNDMVPVIGNVGNVNSIKKFGHLMEGFRRVLEKRKYVVTGLVMEFIRILISCSQFPVIATSTWSSTRDRIIDDIFTYVSHRDVKVRLAAARAVGNVFRLSPYDTAQQTATLEVLRSHLNAMPKGDNHYEKMAVAATSLIALAHTFCSTRELRIQVAYTIIQFLWNHDCDSSIVTNLLSLIGRMLQVSDASKYFCKHLRMLLTEWLREGHTLASFPYQIFRCTSIVQFYRQHTGVIGAVCFLLRQLRMLEEVSSKLNYCTEEVLAVAYPIVTSLARGEQLLELSKIIPTEKLKKLQDERLPEIVFYDLRASDTESFLRTQSRQAFFSQLIIKASIVQKILLLLEEDIDESIVEEDVTDGLNKYAWFVKRYVDETKTQTTFTDMNCYVLRDAVSVVLRILSDQHQVAIGICCDLLRYALDGYLVSLRSEIILLLPGMVNVLVSISMPKREGIEPALSLLRYLVVEKRVELDEAITRLDPFPEEEQFEELVVERVDVFGLREEMHRFARVVSCKGRRVGGLVRLLRDLETRKDELRSLYDEARAVYSSREHQRLIIDVIQQLVELCAHKDDAVRIEAAKCLGELGSADLSTLVMGAEEQLSCDFIPAEERLVDVTTGLLGQLVQTEALFVKRKACAALYAIMHCQGAMSQYSGFYKPFISEGISELVVEAKSPSGPSISTWLPVEQIEHDTWVQGLTVALLDTLWDAGGVCALLAEVCRAQATFAQKLLPLVFELVVSMGPKSLLTDISRNVNTLLASHVSGACTLTLKSIRCVVEAIDYIRCWRFRSGKYDSLLDIDLLLVAEAAGNCAAHFTSVLYAELWFEEQRKAEYVRNPSLLHLTIDKVQERGGTLSKIMRSAYARVGVLDGLMGCGLAHLTDRAQLIAHLEQLGRWDMSLQLHDVTQDSPGVARALRHTDLLHTLSSVPTDLQSQLICATKLGDWSFVPPVDATPSFHLHTFNALKALHDYDTPKVFSEIDRATNFVVRCIGENKVESSRDLYQSLAQLQCLKQLRDFADLKPGASIQPLRQKWLLQDLLKPSDFCLMEEVLSMRCIMVKDQCSSADRVAMLGELYLRLCKLARHARRDDIAMRYAILLKKTHNVAEDQLLAASVEEARYYWGKGADKAGIFLISELLKQLETSSKNSLRSKCLRICGNWMVETKTENPRRIIENYFQASLTLAEDHSDLQESYAAIAKFADLNYVQMKEYLDSPQFETRQDNMRQQFSMIRDLTKDCNQNKDREKEVALHFRTRESDIDANEVNNLRSEAMIFLRLALRHYLLSLEVGDKYDHFVFRLVSLWLNNMGNMNVSALLKERLPKIGSHKFVSLLPQMVPRMSEDELLTETVERAVVDHPYHSLPVVFALKNSHADHRHTVGGNPPPPSIRITAAEEMLRRVASLPVTELHVQQMASFTEALIHLANVVVQQEKGKQCHAFKMPQHFPIVGITSLDNVLVPSIELPVRADGFYGKIVGVYKFSTTFHLVGGINAPKKVECVGTDGMPRSLLLKGKDDPRQDAVMQQVFGVINALLARDEEAAKRKLIMRTYRVVPLSQRSGIIEWCVNTQPIGHYLVGPGCSGGAHVKFRPADIRPAEARKSMSDLAKTSVETKYEGFLNICKKFRPVFHYFFLEKFPSAGMCFERRLAYIRSVATSSMIGYILGLGDRHTVNILIDNATAEVIHIDLGIAFEQGKVLQTPETVPFRLSRDIVDGMGLCGVDGVFRASCERTMVVMRESKDTIVTLLQVLLYDPLYSWTIPGKAMQNESSSSSTFTTTSPGPGVNPLAERALLRVEAKLRGMEQGGGVSKVEGQVNGLIQQAMDPVNLSRLFHGWQANV